MVVDIFRGGLMSVGMLNELEWLVIGLGEKVGIGLDKVFGVIEIMGGVIGGGDVVVLNVGKLWVYGVRIEGLLIEKEVGW